MGFNIQSSDTQQTIQDFTNIVNKSVETAKNKASLKCSSSNNITVLSGSVPNPITGVPVPCPINIKRDINITQTADASCNLSGSFTNDFQNAITDTVQSDVKEWIDNNLKSNQGWLGIAFSAQVAKNQTSATVSTTITNGLVADITNTCSAELFASNNAIVSICGNYDKDFNFNQSAFVTNLTSCVAKNTISFIAKNSVLNDMAQTADNKLSSTQQGIWGGLKWIIIGIVILVVLILVGVLLYFSFGSKSSDKPEERRPLGETERLCVLETEQKKSRALAEGEPLPPMVEKEMFQKCIIEKGERSFQSEEGGGESRGEGGYFDQAREGFSQAREGFNKGREGLRQGYNRFRDEARSLNPYRE